MSPSHAAASSSVFTSISALVRDEQLLACFSAWFEGRVASYPPEDLEEAALNGVSGQLSLIAARTPGVLLITTSCGADRGSRRGEVGSFAFVLAPLL